MFLQLVKYRAEWLFKKRNKNVSAEYKISTSHSVQIKVSTKIKKTISIIHLPLHSVVTFTVKW